MNVCVFCSSSNRIVDSYKQLGFSLGQYLASKGHSLVYGGATGGLMDAVAEGAADKQGEIIGVIPERIINSGRLSKLPTTQIITATMCERKSKMKEIADVFVVLPGGHGTMDEMFDIIGSGTVGEHSKLLICLNVDGFYNHLIGQIEEMKLQAFIPSEERYSPVFVSTLEECFEKLNAIVQFS